MGALPQEQRYTFRDIMEMTDESERVELIDGEIYQMGAPRTAHQLIVAELTTQFGTFLTGKPCMAIPGPFAVRPLEGKDDDLFHSDTMVEPDLSVVCDPEQLDEYGCKGAPRLIAEVLSPTTRGHDRVRKFNLYERAGVPEYWIIDPDTKTVSVHLLQDGRYYSPQIYAAGTPVPVTVLEGFSVDTSALFP